MKKYVITISRGYGSGGKTVAKALAAELGIKYYDRELIRKASEDSGINEALFNLADETHKGRLFHRYNSQEIASPDSSDFLSRENLFNLQAKIIRELHDKEAPCIIVGRCAHYVLRDQRDVVKVFVYADMQQCIERVKEHDGVEADQARRMIEKIDKERAQYNKYFTGREWNDARNYDLCLNTSVVSIEQCVRIIKEYIRIVEE